VINTLNMLNIDVSCLGNHELDHGVDTAKSLIAKTKFPWLMANLLNIKEGNKPIADCQPYYILEEQGYKVGFVGLCEEDWLDSLKPDINIKELKYIDYN